MSARAEQDALDQPFRLLRCAVRAQGDESVRPARLARRGFCNVFGEHVDPMYLGRPIQLRKPLSEFPLDAVAELPCLVQQGRAGAVWFDRYRRRHGVEKKSDDVTVEDARDDLDRGNAHVIGRSPFQADHHVFDHRFLPTGRRSMGELLPREFQDA